MQKRTNITDVGCETQLLLDDHIIDDILNIIRLPEMPVKYLGNPVLDHTATIGESSGVVAQSMMYDEEERLFKMWYTIVDKNKDTGLNKNGYMYRGAYAVSGNGLDWELPDLGIVEYRGSKRNNFFLNDGCGFILKDKHEKDPSRRYKMLSKRAETKGGRVFAHFSSDGLHWTVYPTETSVIPDSRDGGNSFVYDERLGKYVLICRSTVLPMERRYDPDKIGFPDRHALKDALLTDDPDEFRYPPRHAGFPSESDFVMRWETEDFIHRYHKVFPYTDTRSLRISTGRHITSNHQIARAESDDFINWTEPETVIRPDELDPPRLYNMGITLYKEVYIGLLELYNSWVFCRAPGCPQEPETFDLQLTFSRDGKRWERLANRPVFIYRGHVGDFDGGLIAASHPAIIEYEDELRIYYNACNVSHNLTYGMHSVGVARLPKERLVARTAGDELGAILTKPFIVEGDRLEINADARRGLIKVEAIGPAGEPMDGFSVSEAAEIRRNGFSIPVEWNSGSKISELKGKMIRLRFYMEQARLYSFCFKKD